MVIAALMFLSVLSAGASVQAQGKSLLEQGYDAMYNLNFQDAHRLFQQWQQQHPSDAMGPVSDAAAYLFAEFDRLHILQSQFFVNNEAHLKMSEAAPDPALKAQFQAALERTMDLANSKLQKSPQDRHALLAKVLELGLDSDYKSLIEHENITALTEIKAGAAVAQKLLTVHPDCYDAHLASGIQNYLLSLKAAPVRWFLRVTGAETDKSTGLANLKIVAEKGHYLKPFADLLLAVAALRDKDTETARQILMGLAAHFPGNTLYREELKRLG